MSAPCEYAIEAAGLVKTYDMGVDRVHALRGVDFRVGKGEFWAIMGASGSGKSTMLQILGCLDRPTAGSYRLEGREVSGLCDDELSDVRLRRIGFVFQSFNLIPQLTVAENISLPLYYQGVEGEEGAERVRRYAEYVGLADRLAHRPNQLSGGQQQRVAIARALVTEPAVVFADEPTGNLDTEMSREIMAFFVKLNKEGKTIVMVTHEEDIAAYAGHRLVMSDGRIKEMR